MKKGTFMVSWDADACEKEKHTFKEVLSLHIVEMSNEEYIHTIESKWFSDKFYSLIQKHNFSVVIQNTITGERTAIRTFGARFPMVLTKVA
ncbi:hypothetical protein MZM54_04380 [[Brevibacterium] frigoritolerans]|nr:hypothetical protein [Peribacillus frigoritolerans]